MQEGLIACVFLEDIVSNGETYIKSNFSHQLWLSSCLPYLLISVYFNNHNQCREHSLQITLSKHAVTKWGMSVLEQCMPPPPACHSDQCQSHHSSTGTLQGQLPKGREERKVGQILFQWEQNNGVIPDLYLCDWERNLAQHQPCRESPGISGWHMCDAQAALMEKVHRM